MSDVKVCGKCESPKPLSDFSKDKKSRDGFNWQCRKCVSDYKADYYRRNSEKLREKSKNWGRIYTERRWANRADVPAPSTKICPGCKIEKSIDEFARCKNRHGNPARCSRCNSCRRIRGHQNHLKYRGIPDPEVDYKVCAICTENLPAECFYPSKDSFDHISSDCRNCTRLKLQRERKARYYAKNPYLRKQHDQARRAREYGARTGEKIRFDEILEIHASLCQICGGKIAVGDVHFDHRVPLARGGTHTADNIIPTHSWCNMKKNSKLMEELDPLEFP